MKTKLAADVRRLLADLRAILDAANGTAGAGQIAAEPPPAWPGPKPPKRPPKRPKKNLKKLVDTHSG